MKNIVIIVFLAFTCGLSSAQTSDLGNWLIYFGNKKFSKRWDWHNEVQYRNYNAIGDLEQLLLRTGIGYNLTPDNNNVLLGYAFIHSQNYVDNLEDKVTVNENRVYQQFITRQKFGRVRLLHRYRFEQRWIEEQEFRLRFRYFLALNISLSKRDMVENTVYLSAYNEIFLNDQEVIFDRNRLYGGLGYKLNDVARFEVGYMVQMFSNSSRDQINLITFINF